MRRPVKAMSIYIGLIVTSLVLMMLGLVLPPDALPDWLDKICIDGGVTLGLLGLILLVRLVLFQRKIARSSDPKQTFEEP